VCCSQVIRRTPRIRRRRCRWRGRSAGRTVLRGRQGQVSDHPSVGQDHCRGPQAGVVGRAQGGGRRERGPGGRRRHRHDVGRAAQRVGERQLAA